MVTLFLPDRNSLAVCSEIWWISTHTEGEIKHLIILTLGRLVIQFGVGVGAPLQAVGDGCGTSGLDKG